MANKGAVVEQDEKEGRVLSAVNKKKIQDALDTLGNVLEAAGLAVDGVVDEAAAKELGLKCGGLSTSYGHGSPVLVQEVEVQRPWGGAQSFREIDAYVGTSRAEGKISDQLMQARSCIENIMADEDLSIEAKARMLGDVAAELPGRIENPPEYKEESGEKTIKKEDGKFVLYSLDGKKKLGEFDTIEEAKKREAQVKFFKKGDDDTEPDTDEMFTALFGEEGVAVKARPFVSPQDDAFDTIFGERAITRDAVGRFAGSGGGGGGGLVSRVMRRVHGSTIGKIKPGNADAAKTPHKVIKYLQPRERKIVARERLQALHKRAWVTGNTALRNKVAAKLSMLHTSSAPPQRSFSTPRAA